MASELSGKKSFVAGGIAGLTSSVMLQPLDLLKTRLQQQKHHHTNYNPTLVQEIRKLKNYKELWRGVLPSCLRTSVGSAIYLTLLSKSRFYLLSLKTVKQAESSSVLPRLSHLENLLIGFVVRAMAGYITMPITIIKTRYESNLYSYNSMYESIENIYFDGNRANEATGNAKGTIRNFFKGSFVTLSRDCPYAGLYVLFYEAFKVKMGAIAGHGAGAGASASGATATAIGATAATALDGAAVPFSAVNAAAVNTAAAVLAAAMATTITAPFDSIKTRMQLASSKVSIWHTMQSLISEPGGARNLFKGLSLRLGRKGLSAGISWCIYEELLKV